MNLKIRAMTPEEREYSYKGCGDTEEVGLHRSPAGEYGFQWVGVLLRMG